MATYISRFFPNSDPDRITIKELREFLALRIEENQNLEYKPRGILVKADNSIIQPQTQSHIVGFLALAKSVAGFANAEGGLLVLGVKEKVENFKGTISKIRPGAIAAIPPTVTREMIETNLLAKIQYPLEGLKIVPVRLGSRSQHCVYLVDVPQSTRPPHRVGELHYYQRYNFDVLAMHHYQIADLFGKRTRPNLHLVVSIKRRGTTTSSGRVTSQRGAVVFSIENIGPGTAKFPYLSLALPGTSRLSQFGVDGNGHEGLTRLPSSGPPGTVKFGAAFEIVIHPGTQLPVAALDIDYVPGHALSDILVNFELAAEGTELKRSTLFISGQTIVEELVGSPHLGAT